jgi:hypothetical protein
VVGLWDITYSVCVSVGMVRGGVGWVRAWENRVSCTRYWQTRAWQHVDCSPGVARCILLLQNVPMRVVNGRTEFGELDVGVCGGVRNEVE